MLSSIVYENYSSSIVINYMIMILNMHNLLDTELRSKAVSVELYYFLYDLNVETMESFATPSLQPLRLSIYTVVVGQAKLY